ncbi:MAG: rhodanese-like domain-containing protein [Desulfovermiculus sp.]|nr:rhodanese-like domain-containing protein [Desulfovermiculus sp.]
MTQPIKIILPLVISCIVFTCLAAVGSESPDQEMVDKQCIRCHGDYSQEKDIVAGTFIKRSQKAKTIQVKVGPDNFMVKYDVDTILNIADELSPKIPIKIKLRPGQKDLWADELWTMPPIEIPEDKLVSTQEIEELIAGEGEQPYMLVDSRPEMRFHEGHIPTAKSIPFTVMHTRKSELPEDRDTLLIFYCGGQHCTLSPMASQMAEQWRYSQVKVYHDGAPVWKKKGNILLTTRTYLRERKGNYVLLDTRDRERASQGHIPEAVSLTLQEISARKDRFPLDRQAPIILYSQNTDRSRLQSAVQTIRSWGYKNVSVLDQGFQGWVSAGEEVEKGQPEKEIVYQPKPLPGEIPNQEFAMIIENQPEDKVILDVRAPSEVAAGSLPSAVQIPLDELQLRMNELPRDKEIIAYCSTGMRAEMAYNMLKKEGYKVRFLNDTIDIVGKKVYLGTTVELSEDTADIDALAEIEIEVSTPDSALCARLIRHGQTAFERRKYQEAKKLFWKAIMADPTSQLAWRSYDMSVIYALAERAENDPGCIGAPDVPVSEPGTQSTGLFSKEDEGC